MLEFQRIHRSCLTMGLLVLSGCSSFSKPETLSLDLQTYPTGQITTLRIEKEFPNTDRTVALHLGYNSADRGDAGEHDEEKGGGPGIGLSARHYWGENLDGWFAGARMDLWSLDLDWQRNSGPGAPRGQTDIIVLQPTVLAGYRWHLPDMPLSLEVYAAGGVEINLATSGEDVGEGAIGLAGIGLSYRF